MDGDLQAFTPWTSDGAERLRTAAAELVAALTEHAEAVATASDADIVQVFEANDRLLPLAVAYSDAQFDFTGNFGPFGLLHEDDDELAELDSVDEVPDAGPAGPATGFTVLERRDYAVLDEDAVLEAGRQAYLSAGPDADELAAQADVQHLGRALYQLAHAGGWHSLGDADGLRAQAGFVAVIEHPDLLGPDPDEWPEDLSVADGELLYLQRDAY
ncbi:hypothetical protein ACPPVT_12875 [Angustibacter sp. McL0619]|uniref:hypothetical protein n=1 Tax=Angustibacter sp. McL0619 TaxID=3415676 RepID=UPI003CEA8030